MIVNNIEVKFKLDKGIYIMGFDGGAGKVMYMLY